ncbi:MAG: aminodeoxychorismate/anthranilate synthase component II [Desulfovibrio sp.]|nr:MAG: aminodeoxychorismate/anthranilate synthase component II [Desulfovibrio sp.]
MFLLIDNFDSFTFNLVQAFYRLGLTPEVLRNDRPELLDMAKKGDPKLVCISPGPSRPDNAGLCLEFLSLLPPEIPVLGVCLGHQCLGQFAGATVEVGPNIMHGKTTDIHHTGMGMFSGLANPLTVGRYHSLLVRAEQVPDKLDVTAWTDEDEVMGIQYKDRPWAGLQFHPESVLTPEGLEVLANFPGKLL